MRILNLAMVDICFKFGKSKSLSQSSLDFNIQNTRQVQTHMPTEETGPGRRRFSSIFSILPMSLLTHV